MKICLFLIVLSMCVFGESAAQSKDQPQKSEGQQHLTGIAVYVPLGSFSKTHRVGLGIDYSRSRYRFGEEVKTKKFAGWVLNGGLSYYPGKKASFTGYNFRYGGYVNLFATGGIIINPILRGNVILTTGPSLDLYKSTVNGGFRVNLSAHYFISPLIAIGASVTYLKHSRSESILAAGLKVAYAF